MNVAFVSSPLPLRASSLLTSSRYASPSSQSNTGNIKVAYPLRLRVRMMSTGDDNLSDAEKTRRLLAESESLVKFRREITESDPSENEFRYTSGTTDGGFDIWLIAALLTVLVPAIGFAIGVATGNIDVNPR